MKSSFAVFLLPTLAVAGPIEQRQTGTTAKEFSRGGCAENIFIFSRGSTEVGNMGTIAGPPTSNGLKRALGDVATEGVDYPAALSTNFLPGGADPAGIRTMAAIVNKAATDCPNSNILVGGYSQGAAMVHRVIEDLDASVQDQVAGVVTFGDTQNEQDNGQINNFPPEKTLVICNRGDAVCAGTLTILAPHLDYTRRAGEAVEFLAQKAGQATAARKARKTKMV